MFKIMGEGKLETKIECNPEKQILIAEGILYLKWHSKFLFKNISSVVTLKVWASMNGDVAWAPIAAKCWELWSD